jgi:hypothetical protein
MSSYLHNFKARFLVSPSFFGILHRGVVLGVSKKIHEGFGRIYYNLIFSS